MIETPLAPYLFWAKTRRPAAIDLAGSNLLACSIDDLPGAREALDITARNDNGYEPLVDAIARHYGIRSDRVATATGCSGANFITAAALVGAGDHVLVERPAYDPLAAVCRLLGASVERFERRFADQFAIDLDDLARRLTPRTRLLVVTTPHNPSGVSLTSDALHGLGAVAARVGAIVLVDEVYLDVTSLIHADAPTLHSAARIDGPFVVTNSLTKSYGLAGLRCGWAIGSPSIAERIRRARDVVDNAGPATADRISAHAFTLLPQLADRAGKILAGNVERAREFFAAHPHLEVAQLPRAPVTFPRLAHETDASAFVRHLLDRHGLAVAPGLFFEAPAYFRLSLAGDPDLLARGLEKLAHALQERVS
jgi:aspartate/methionine/tyrosine aminotransferase